MPFDLIRMEADFDRIAIFEARIALLWERFPLLYGFHVTDDLTVTHVGVHSWRGCTNMREINEPICVELAELADLVADLPEGAVELVRGRTFARALH